MFPQSVMIWVAKSSAGVGLLCFIKSTAYQENLEHFMLPSADKLYGDGRFLISSMPHLTDAEACAKGAPTKSAEINIL